MKCAYTDKEKTNLIPAKEASSNTIHYCEMIECPAEVYPASLDSIYQSAHFRTYKDSAHLEGCPFQNSYLDTSKYEKENFSLSNFFEKYLTSNNNENTNNDIEIEDTEISQNIVPLPNSLFTFYKYLLNSSLSDKIDGVKVRDILVDLRSEYLYTKYVTGEKIVQAKLTYIDSKNRILTFKYPISEIRKNNNKHLYLKLKIHSNLDFYKLILRENYIIVANFQKETNIVKNKQIRKI